LYAKVIKGFEGQTPAPFWRAQSEAVDTRLVPGETNRSEFTFPAGVERLRVRLLHRRFWHDVAESKSWPDNEIVVLDQKVTVEAGKEVRWSGR
jgi:hypothetical protein